MLPTCTAWGPCNLILHNVIALLSSLSLKYWAKLLRNFLQLWLITAAAAVRSSTSQFARRAWADNPPHFWSALFVWLYLYSIRFLLFEEYNFYLEAIRFVLAWTGNLPQLWSTFFFVSIQSEDFVWGLGFCMGVGICILKYQLELATRKLWSALFVWFLLYEEHDLYWLEPAIELSFGWLTGAFNPPKVWGVYLSRQPFPEF